MISRIKGLPRQVFGFEVRGKMTRDEMDDVMIDFEATIANGYDVALLVEYHPDMVESPEVQETGFRNRLAARGRTRRFAFVGDHKWQSRVDEFSNFVGCEARMFPPGQRDSAIAWLLETPFLKVEDDAG